MDARRLRGRADAGDGLLRLRAEGRGDGAVRCASPIDAFPGICRNGSRSSSSSRSPRWRSASFAAIGQTNIKRLMAYSSIGHMGFALVGLAAGTAEGVAGRADLPGDLRRHDARHLRLHPVHAAQRRVVENISDLAGLSRTNPRLAFFFAMLLFSLAGMPPLAGFFAKFYVFLAAIQAGLFALAVIGVLTSVVGAFYYLRVVKVMYFDEPAKRFDPVRVKCAGRAGGRGLRSSCCSSSIRRRWSARPRSPRSRCSDVLFARSTRSAGGYGSSAFDSDRLDQRVGADARGRRGVRTDLVCDLGADGGSWTKAAAWVAPRGNLASSVLEVVAVAPRRGDTGFCRRARARGLTVSDSTINSVIVESEVWTPASESVIVESEVWTPVSFGTLPSVGSLLSFGTPES